MKALHFALVVFALVLTSSAFGQDDRPLPIPPALRCTRSMPTLTCIATRTRRPHR